MVLDLWSIIILLFIGQGIFSLLALWVSKQQSRPSSRLYLSFLLLVLLWMLSEFLAVRNVYKINVNLFYGTRYGSWLILGPLVYFFLRSITERNWQIKARHLWHFLPFLLFVLLIPCLSGETLGNRQIHYGMLSVFDYRPKTVTPFEWLYAHIFYLQFLHFGAYLLYNLKKVQRYQEKLRQVYAGNAHLVWLWLFHGLLLLTLIFAAAYLYILFQSDFYSRSLDYLYVLPMGLFVYSVGFHLLRIDWIVIEPKTKARYQKSPLKAADKALFSERLSHYMSTEQPHLKNELRLADLARGLDISSHQLSQVINEQFEQTFFDFINGFRVKEAQSLIQAHPEWTLLQVAFAAGFNNKTSFGNAFKKFTGATPSTFRKKQLNSEKL